MAVVLTKPKLIRQKKANSCWFACLKMLLLWHEGDKSINSKQVSDLASWTESRSYEELPTGFIQSRNLEVLDLNFNDASEIEAELLNYGPFMGGGTVGKMLLGKRKFGHAILIYGVTSSGHLLHNDPMLGSGCKIKVASYLAKQDGERIRYWRNLARVSIEAGLKTAV